MLRSTLRKFKQKNKVKLSNIVTNDVLKASKFLDKYGGVLVKNNLDKKKISLMLDPNKIKKITNQEFVDSKYYHLKVGSWKRGSKSTYIKAEKIFKKLDLGIIDTNNLNLSNYMGEYVDSLIIKILPIVASALNLNIDDFFYHFNFYYYKNVSNPRCFHRDSLKPRIKVFIPLTNCNKIEQGPYAFKPYSHKNKLDGYIEFLSNILIKSDIGDKPLDSTLTSSIEMLPIFAELRDFFITRQDCDHGVFPCKVSYSRMSLVLNIFCK